MKKTLLVLCILFMGAGTASASPSQISTGLNTTCKIDTGALTCSGDNSSGQIGDNTTTTRTTFTAVSGMGSGVTQVSVAVDGKTVCAIKSGALYCWGDNTYGQIGDGTTMDRHTPTAVDTTHGMSGTVVQVSTSKDHTCAAQSTLGSFTNVFGTFHGFGFCWGDNSVGQLGDNNNTQLGTIIVPTAGAPYYVQNGAPQFATAQGLTCFNVLSTNLTGYDDVMCAGTNANGRTGQGTGVTTGNTAAPQDVSMYGLGGATTLNTLVTVSGTHACLLGGTTGAKPYCWGVNDDGEIGDGTYGAANDRATPTAVTGFTSATSISAGGAHTCATNATAGACWGKNDHGQLDRTASADVPSPVSLNAAHLAASSITAGDSTTCLIHASAFYCFGNNSSGQDGDGTQNDPYDPYTPPTIAIHKTSAGSFFDCAIGTYKNAGALFCWGDNSHSELGQGMSGSYIDVPSAVPGLDSDMQDVSASMDSIGGYTACAIQAGDLYCWGKNDSGQVGDGSSGSDVLSPTLIAMPNGNAAVKVSTAGDHTCALVTGTYVNQGYMLYCWGSNAYGQLGLGGGAGTGNFTTPQLVPGLDHRMVDVSVNTQYSCAIQNPETGTTTSTYCWGKNDYGQLGHGTIGTNTNSPGTALSLSTGQTGLSAGWGHACVLENGTTPYCWGDDANGQLGNNSTTTTATPQAVVVTTMTSTTSISAGGDHTCAKGSGTPGNGIYCWGWNGNCQNGQTRVYLGHTVCQLDEHVPTWSTTNAGAYDVYAGGYHSMAYAQFSIGPEVYTTGRNDSGQCGQGTATTSVLTFSNTVDPSPNW